MNATANDAAGDDVFRYLAHLLCAAQRQENAIGGVTVPLRRLQEALGLPELAYPDEAETALRKAVREAVEQEQRQEAGEKIRAGLAARKAEGKPVGGSKPGHTPRVPRESRLAAWQPGGAARAAREANPRVNPRYTDAPRSGRPWTEKETAIAGDLTLTAAEAAAQIGRTEEAVVQKRAALRRAQAAGSSSA